MTKESYDVKQYYKYLSRLIFEIFWSYKASKFNLYSKVNFKNIEVFEYIYNSNKNATIILSHIGNWELFCQWAGLFIPKLNTITLYTPIKSRVIDKIMIDIRSRFGVKMISTKDVLGLYRAQRQNSHLINLFAIDQNPGNPKEQYWTEFFNEKIPFITGSEKFAVSQKQEVYYLDVTMDRDIYILELIKIDYDRNIEYDLTHKSIKLIEDNIIRNPYIWLLSHNRFKHNRKV